MDVRHLRYFVEVARAGTVAAASVSLSMEASPLSRRIRDLERHLGAPLFVRGGRRLDLTEAGRRLLPLAEEVLSAFDRVEALRTATRAVPFRVGLVPGISATVTRVLEDVLGRLRPGAELEFLPASSPVQNRKVLDQQLDIATVRVVVSDERLGSVPIGLEEIEVLAGPQAGARFPGHRLSAGALEGWTLLTSYPLNFSADLDRFLVEQRITDVRVVPRADANALAVLAQHGERVTLNLVGTPRPTSASLVRLVTERPILAATHLVWRRDRVDLDDIVRAVRERVPAEPDRFGPARRPS
ncbi:LysR family transcriptional regulator [Amycolatopsis thermophila]|uniref:DNA-binding transcriptional LysR family regulator n=1 Tax=Amycolatopsis thermophila TaxID=206084 RepID=A0ABU0F603_9PSEU|nr:LysR family transcriptional regulator [Amycolatopsis thermophila]MDQ0382764.1 DNA-binding transcriptional LysR family regulator [Amycolatopsis thermophila]